MKGIKRIVCAVLNLIPLFALASTPIEPYTAPASASMERVPSVICLANMTRDDLHYLRLGAPKAGVETCYPIDSRHHRERGYIVLITDRGLLLGFKDALFAPECGYWTAIDDLKQKLLDTFEPFRVQYEGWHIESCEAQ